MKKSLVILLAATLGLAACNQEKKGAGGLLYTIHKSENKEKIKEGDIIKMNLIVKNDKDSVFFSSYDNEMPQVFMAQKKMYAGDQNDALALLGEGDSATFKINLDTLEKYTKQPKGEQFKNDKFQTFVVKIEKVFKKNAGEVDSAFQKRANDFFQADFKATMDKVKNSEDAKLKKYIDDKDLKTKVSASGLHYIITTPGSAERPALGDTVEINYTGSLTKKGQDGKYKVFDTSDAKVSKESGLDKMQMGRTYGPTKMVYGQTVPGFTEAISLVGVGGKATVVMPSKLGYGEQGNPQAGIGPFAPIAFDIEIVKIIKGTTPPPAPVQP
ncbi:FKBP-type peptidyl-prolyl cis-trans isomerase [Pedobacter cryotolerans]|uniref:peptidylprolyl isomerase n=1 Tax=Pedobacter cryotolerans TaxID=2571270 RepID=A0A4U1BYA0_9SPHI|nr:FKBP-type peptidyl-prolyl cis-trans isomerase [Pedobacter cryotolerans]TKB98001.1 peptidylprolyl isomerase [Pedobacter cryotolerans]